MRYRFRLFLFRAFQFLDGCSFLIGLCLAVRCFGLDSGIFLLSRRCLFLNLVFSSCFVFLIGYEAQ